MKKVVQAYFEEAKWCSEGYFPKVEEYMQVSLVTTCYHMLATASFLGMGKIADKQAFEWISNYPKTVKASQVICRLMDDIVSHEVQYILILMHDYKFIVLLLLLLTSVFVV